MPNSFATDINIIFYISWYHGLKLCLFPWKIFIFQKPRTYSSIPILLFPLNKQAAAVSLSVRANVLIMHARIALVLNMLPRSVAWRVKIYMLTKHYTSWMEIRNFCNFGCLFCLSISSWNMAAPVAATYCARKMFCLWRKSQNEHQLQTRELPQFISKKVKYYFDVKLEKSG
jgi:hypothetical protein